LLEPARQPLTRGQVAIPRELEILVCDPVKPDSAPEPPPPVGDPETPPPIAPTPQPEMPVLLERQQRSRKPSSYLADYHVGPVDLLSLRNN